ncbi:MAG TPA: Na+/H+ antiporter NhaA [Nocardioides sp.]|uniref:Na+/H+ antiporter NhaA n=1 Tax=Nocardioides sp. TaxID=35761 RepID=UPI002D7F3E48|nr:Na+/H+ antiporter NhaA [Nocardioides sp.]HET6652380.1 Na+/H+ antiporter NhaA [Nocardioides sp.]
MRDLVAESRPGSARTALVAQLSTPLRQFLATESGSAGALLVAALLGLAWANSPWSGGYEALWATVASVQIGDAVLAMDLGHWVNDGLMALFFFVIGLEVRRELSVGELTDRRRVRLPLVAGAAGMVVPALVYLMVSPAGEAQNGWGIVIGTDTAFMLGALAVVGPRFSTQLRIFLLTLTVIDDIVAVLVIGVVYSDSLRLGWLVLALVSLAALPLLDRVEAWRASPYVVVILVLWLATVQAGLHSSIAGMLGGLLIAARAPRRESVEGAARRFRAFRQSPMVDLGRSASQSLARVISVNERLQSVLHPWTSYLIVPLFAFANAGVDLRNGVLADALASPVTWGVILGLTLGKPLGIMGSVLLGSRWGVGRLPQGVGLGHVTGGAALSGIGFTVALLITGLAFDDPELRDQATVGVLLSAVLATALGWAAFVAGKLFRDEGDADLPRTLDRPVDPAVDHIRGRVDAPLTLVEYGDFECPFCARATGVTRELRERFGDELRYVFRHLPLPDVHAQAELAGRAALAADRQQRFWDMHDVLFAHQDELELEDLIGYAAELGLDVERFVRDLDEDEIQARIRADVASAEASGARGTPTFFVNGRRHVGPYDASTLARELRAEGVTP